ncbi:hypothetical protein [Reinekea blandensis]|uniref:Uncharacterized protein n=1 Tax=Reinekea blandensis MED297 TaxID=314283 RepID=A4BDG6_9GAMM|nr:hypothetical protein [Reinekea blandensis]EAR09910.1 hypothetical protein MED297_06159 [Reinekea sp. MED297] [Reinekea blandensis MED297]
MVSEPVNPSTRLKLALTFAVLLAIAINWIPEFDRAAQDYLSDTISSNVVVFGVVRTLNGVISVVQSAEVGVGVAGVGLGEIFDPVNDLIERFSGLLLVTLTALGIQQVILLLTTSTIMKIVLSVMALMPLYALWKKPNWRSLVLRLFLVMLLLRYLLSIQVGLIWLFDQLYFDATGEQALSVLEASAQVLQNLRDTLTEIDLRRLIFGSDTPALDSEDMGTRLSTSVVTLIVGMLFKSILIPVGTVWLGYKAAGALILLRRQP